MNKLGFLKIGCVNLKVEVGAPFKNVENILEVLENIESSVTVFPELSLVGYTAADLFFQNQIIDEVYQAIEILLKNNKHEGIIIVGSPLLLGGSLFNCAIVIQKNKILGVVPKYILPNYREFYEKRWFKSGFDTLSETININGIEVPFGHLIFNDSNQKISFGIEICEDMWGAITPGGELALAGANLIFNLSASNETIKKEARRHMCVIDNSRRNVGGYAYVSSGCSESTSETVYSGCSIVAQCGDELANNMSFSFDNVITYADFDIDKINYYRRISTNMHLKTPCDFKPIFIPVNIAASKDFKFVHKFNQMPFIPKNEIEEVFRRICMITSKGLEKRMITISCKMAVIGISGGLDSTLALLTTMEAFKNLGYDLNNIIAVSMPGLATSKRTLSQAQRLCRSLGVRYMEKDITEDVLNHFKLIEHDPKQKDIVYENAQARMRTLILMDLANKHQGIVIGTGNMSEIALGFMTYGGDALSMYSLNCGIPKTLVKFMVEQHAIKYPTLSDVLKDILNTPYSPELSDQEQRAEDIVGNYIYNDFIMHRMLECGDKEERIAYLLSETFALDQLTSKTYVKNFLKRFYTQQFKRQVSPDGPKVLEISLSPRSDFKMPSDIKR